MHEDKLELINRKIRNGKRKQAEAVQRERERIWEILKTAGIPEKNNYIILPRIKQLHPRNTFKWIK